MAETGTILGTLGPEAVVCPRFACLLVESLASITGILGNREVAVVDTVGSIP